ncbi:unnamed protein product [Amoebophrya sp. A25]|nr:unnamed protein product [Amoebophrya sp. A25]|eukprot:GSA25T00015277001.1
MSLASREALQESLGLSGDLRSDLEGPLESLPSFYSDPGDALTNTPGLRAGAERWGLSPYTQLDRSGTAEAAALGLRAALSSNNVHGCPASMDAGPGGTHPATSRTGAAVLDNLIDRGRSNTSTNTTHGSASSRQPDLDFKAQIRESFRQNVKTMNTSATSAKIIDTKSAMHELVSASAAQLSLSSSRRLVMRPWLLTFLERHLEEKFLECLWQNQRYWLLWLLPLLSAYIVVWLALAVGGDTESLKQLDIRYEYARDDVKSVDFLMWHIVWVLLFGGLVSVDAILVENPSHWPFLRQYVAFILMLVDLLVGAYLSPAVTPCFLLLYVVLLRVPLPMVLALVGVAALGMLLNGGSSPTEFWGLVAICVTASRQIEVSSRLALYRLWYLSGKPSGPLVDVNSFVDLDSYNHILRHSPSPLLPARGASSGATEQQHSQEELFRHGASAGAVREAQEQHIHHPTSSSDVQPGGSAFHKRGGEHMTNAGSSLPVTSGGPSALVGRASSPSNASDRGPGVATDKRPAQSPRLAAPARGGAARAAPSSVVLQMQPSSPDGKGVEEADASFFSPFAHTAGGSHHQNSAVKGGQDPRAAPEAGTATSRTRPSSPVDVGPSTGAAGLPTPLDFALPGDGDAADRLVDPRVRPEDVSLLRSENIVDLESLLRDHRPFLPEVENVVPRSDVAKPEGVFPVLRFCAQVWATYRKTAYHDTDGGHPPPTWPIHNFMFASARGSCSPHLPPQKGRAIGPSNTEEQIIVDQYYSNKSKSSPPGTRSTTTPTGTSSSSKATPASSSTARSSTGVQGGSSSSSSSSSGGNGCDDGAGRSGAPFSSSGRSSPGLTIEAAPRITKKWTQQYRQAVAFSPIHSPLVVDLLRNTLALGRQNQIACSSSCGRDSVATHQIDVAVHSFEHPCNGIWRGSLSYIRLPFPAWHVQACLWEPELYPKIDRSCSESRLLERHPAYVLKTATYPGFSVISTRVFCCLTRRFRLSDGTRVLLSKSVASVPEDGLPDRAVTGNLSASCWFTTPLGPNVSDVALVSHVNPQGSVGKSKLAGKVVCHAGYAEVETMMKNLRKVCVEEWDLRQKA